MAPTPSAAAIAEVVAGIVCELLRVATVSWDDDFLALGGASLSAVHLVVRIDDRFGVELPLAYVFDHSTIGDIATAVADELASTSSAVAT